MYCIVLTIQITRYGLDCLSNKKTMPYIFIQKGKEYVNDKQEYCKSAALGGGGGGGYEDYRQYSTSVNREWDGLRETR